MTVREERVGLILKHLKKHPGQTINEVQAALELKEGPTWRIFGELAEAGTIERWSLGWRVAPRRSA